jgi:hypothetical protein
MIDRLIRFLQWTRICDENGQISLTTIAFGVALYCILAQKPVSLPELSVFAMALGGYHCKKLYRHRNEQAAMQTAHATGIAKIDADKAIALQGQSDQSAKLTDKVFALEKKVADLATPEMQERIRTFFNRK